MSRSILASVTRLHSTGTRTLKTNHVVRCAKVKMKQRRDGELSILASGDRLRDEFGKAPSLRKLTPQVAAAKHRNRAALISHSQQLCIGDILV